jgi:hypothetical protein
VAGTAAAAVAVAGTAVADGVAAVFEADTTDAASTAVAGTGMLATIDGTAAGAGGAAVGIRGGCFRFHGLTRITVITDQDTGMDQGTATGTDRVTATDTDSVILWPLFSGLIG